MTSVFVQQIGSFARDAVHLGSGAVVMGLTSRGAFLQVDGRRVIFLSTETWAGPLTLNLSKMPHAMEVGERARLESDIIYFENEGLCIDTSQAAVWIPPIQRQETLLPAQRRSTMEQVIWRSFDASARSEAGFSTLLAELLDRIEARPASSQIPVAALQRLQAEWGLTSRDGASLPALSAVLVSLLGMGIGLTPSGDDLAAGFLLALNRWGKTLAPGFPVRVLNQAVVVAARRATTALSVSLLECAAAGQADQRLMEALDGLVTGQPGPEIVYDRLNAYGATSGLDTLVGFSLAVV